MKSLFRRNEAWTPKASDIAEKFGKLVKKFIRSHPDCKIRELEYIMINELSGVSMASLVERLTSAKKKD